MSLFLFVCFLLSSCEYIGHNEQNLKTDEITEKNSLAYKIGTINGINSNKIIDHLKHFAPESNDKNAPILNVAYSYKESTAIIMKDKRTLGNYITFKIKIEYLNQIRYVIISHESYNLHKWEYDQILFYKIAKEIFLTMIYIDKFIQDKKNIEQNLIEQNISNKIL